jgi:hypothetical protein
MNDLNSDGSKRQLGRDPESDPLSITTPDVKVPIVIGKGSMVDTGDFGTGVDKSLLVSPMLSGRPGHPTIEDINGEKVIISPFKIEDRSLSVSREQSNPPKDDVVIRKNTDFEEFSNGASPRIEFNEGIN